MNTNENYAEVDLRELFKMLTQKWWMIFICCIVTSGIAGYVSYTMLDNQYIADTTLFIGREKDSLESINLSTINISNQLISDYMEIAGSRLVSEKVIEELELNMSISQLRGNTSVSSKQGSRIFKISFTSSDPQLSADIANKLAQVIITQAEEIIGVKNIQVIDKAITPKWPIKPNRKINIIAAGIIGILLGIFSVFIIEFIDYTFKRPEDIERILKLNVLGTIPKFKGEKRSKINPDYNQKTLVMRG